ncbi:MAG: hypothetical protein HY660_09685 [Armatimonadetes bacterium]|nr:hypothetical protein [Armatimonadota bacterium]
MRHAVAVIVGVAILVFAGLSGAAQSTTVPLSRITPEDLLAAGLTRADLKSLGADPDKWWPEFPQFNVGIGGPILPGMRFYVTQTFRQVGDPARRRIEVALSLYGDTRAAGRAFPAYADHPQADKGTTTVVGPSTGDESRYFTRTTNDGLRVTSVRFRTGPVIGRIAVLSQSEYEQGATLARYAEPVVQRIRALLRGQLKAPALPAARARLLPPAATASGVGPVLGAAAVPMEAWAVEAGGDDALKTLALLRQIGATDSVMRRYGLRAAVGHIVEAAVFQVKDTASGAAWVDDTVRAGKESKGRFFAAGKTGKHATFLQWPNGTYEIQFAKGHVVGDVICKAPFGKTSSVCEAAVRQLGERWFAALPSR